MGDIKTIDRTVKDLKNGKFITENTINNEYFQDHITQVGVNNHLYDNYDDNELIDFDDDNVLQIVGGFYGNMGMLSFGDARAVVNINPEFLADGSVKGQGTTEPVAWSFDEFRYFTNCTTIFDRAISRCPVQSITIPRSVTNIVGALTLQGLFDCKSLKVDKVNPVYTDMRKNCMVEKDTMRLITATSSTCEDMPPIKSIKTGGIYLIGHNIENVLSGQAITEDNCTINLVLPGTLENMETNAIAGCAFDTFDMSKCNKLVPENTIAGGHPKDAHIYNIACKKMILKNVTITDCSDYALLTNPEFLTQLELISVPEIGTAAFKDCTNLNTIIVRDVIPPVVTDTSLPKTATIYVPDEAVDIYKEYINNPSNPWLTYTSQIKPLSEYKPE